MVKKLIKRTIRISEAHDKKVKKLKKKYTSESNVFRVAIDRLDEVIS